MDDQERVRVLLVDDELDFLEATAKALFRRGIDPVVAHNAREAMNELEAHLPDVAVLDLKMPGMDGTELFQWIRERWSELPVIMLTGHGTIPQALDLTRKGVFDYLVKPVDVEELAAKVKRAGAEARVLAEEAPNEEMLPGEMVRLLLVDDEEELVTALGNALRRRGMKILTAAQGGEALLRLEHNPVDVVVLDIKMPGMDGLEVLKRIKAGSADIEVILLTGHPKVENAVEGLKLGAFEYVVKPVDVEKLSEVIRRAYRRRMETLLSRDRDQVNDILHRYPE